MKSFTKNNATRSNSSNSSSIQVGQSFPTPKIVVSQKKRDQNFLEEDIQNDPKETFPKERKYLNINQGVVAITKSDTTPQAQVKDYQRQEKKQSQSDDDIPQIHNVPKLLQSMSEPNSSDSTNKSITFNSRFIQTGTFEDLQREFDGSEIQKIGNGGFGQVFQIYSKLQKEAVALKIVKQANGDILKEINLLKSLDHPNILRIYDYYEDHEQLYIVTELCNGGTLFQQQMERLEPFFQDQAKEIMFQLMSAVKFAHSQQIVHRDIQTENILFLQSKTGGTMVKLIDWGLGATQDKNYLKDMCGTIYNIPPQILDGQPYDQKCDIWSAGTVLYSILAGENPFLGSKDDILHQIKNAKLDFSKHVWKGVSSLCIDLIKKMINKDKVKRISASQVLEHPWFKHNNHFDSQLDTQDKQKFENLKQFKPVNQLLGRAVLAIASSHLIDKNQRVYLYQLWRQLDSDADGKISKDQLMEGFIKYFGHQDDKQSLEKIKELVQKLMNRIDGNKSGYIQFSQFSAATMDRVNILNQDKIKQIFDIFDENKDGFITKEEIQQLLNITESHQLDNSLEEVDVNSDGQISIEEFSTMMKNFVEQSTSYSQDS